MSSDHTQYFTDDPYSQTQYSDIDRSETPLYLEEDPYSSTEQPFWPGRASYPVHSSYMINQPLSLNGLSINGARNGSISYPYPDISQPPSAPSSQRNRHYQNRMQQQVQDRSSGFMNKDSHFPIIPQELDEYSPPMMYSPPATIPLEINQNNMKSNANGNVNASDYNNGNVIYKFTPAMEQAINNTAAAVANASTPMIPMTQLNDPLDFISAPSRTVYLGNIPSNLTVKELLDHVRSGVVEDVKIIPEKLCAFISFVDESSALLFHSDAILKRLNIGGKDIKIGWGKPTTVDPMISARIINDDATRNVFIGHLNKTDNDSCTKEPITEAKLREDLEDFGEIETVKIIPEKGIAFVHFSSITSAIKCVHNLRSMNPYYENKKIAYGKDRCAFITKTQQHNAAQFLGVQSGMENMAKFSDRKFISNALLQQSAAAAAIATAAGGPNNLGNRTVYLGNLPKDIKIEEICNVVRGGLLQSVKLLSDRYVCFVTFIDPTAAAQFYAMSSLHGLTIQKKRCKVGWGKHSGPLPNALALAVSNGASRNVYIGNINFEKDAMRDPRIFTEDSLRKLFRQYGEVEQINFLPEKNCCFINFTNISNAILALDKIKSNPHFEDLKINFGKDRCGNVPHQVR
ncbi:hypothetical protein NCAS_0H01040 [Naumovozyma castellii]|uniref:RRM domain-containing protein n=1 Tax=Naumovozyma castellii TaxID=27288 RepID=G0VIT7_NAUCA|nr:hypothetical protein NCAS_0H01040 [Naumovozyma castellii CBS 4309]CCC71414.1 hypothetical protein NCAS_0H01040 [Naumovozyma castellii CBS 4309]